nr:transporter substrate-binding domain-containing protein [Schwartzia sp. (in: firmicutes)]
MKGRTGRLAALFGIVFSVLFYFCAHAYMQEADSSSGRIVHVGILTQRGYSVLQEDGVATGFDAEYMYKIAQYAGFKIDYHTYKDFRELLSSLEDGEIQIALGISQTDERRRRFIFT